MIKKLFKRIFSKPATLGRETQGTAAHLSMGTPKKVKASYGIHKPKVWAVSEHKIDQRLVSHNAIRVCETLQNKGYKAFVVGGAVRDLLLGMRPKDFDAAATQLYPYCTYHCNHNGTTSCDGRPLCGDDSDGMIGIIRP